MIEKLKMLHKTHVKDYINLFNNEGIEYSIIVKTENISVIASKKIDLKELFDEYVSIKITNEMKKDIEFWGKSMSIKIEELNGVKLDCNFLISHQSVQTFAIDNQVVYICNIDKDTEEKIRFQEHYNKVKKLKED